MVNKKFFEELEEMIRNNEEGVKTYMDDCVKGEAHIEFHNECGDSITCKIKGIGSLLFDGICTILKALALGKTERMVQMRRNMFVLSPKWFFTN